MYAAGVVSRIKTEMPQLELFGCAGPKLQAEGVKPVIDAAKLAVVGLAEVVRHLPPIYREYRKLVQYARRHRPRAALLTDSPDFHLRLARQLKQQDVRIFYLVAPQVWAWRQGRVKKIRRLVDELFCLFPFEEKWFRDRGVNARYIGHPLASMVKPTLSRSEFLAKHELPRERPYLVLLPGSRAGEAVRHMPALLEAIALLKRKIDVSVLLATPGGFQTRAALQTFREPLAAQAIKVVENETWDAIGHADLALAASGTVTVEAAVLGTPMVTFYKVSPLTWYGGRHLVKVPFLSMVNLIADRALVPELMQNAMTPQGLAAEAYSLLSDHRRAGAMRADLARLTATLRGEGDPLAVAAHSITNYLGARTPSLQHLSSPASAGRH